LLDRFTKRNPGGGNAGNNPGGGNAGGNSGKGNPGNAGRGNGGSNAGNPRNAQGFKNYGQYVAAQRVSENLGISLSALKAKMTGSNAMCDQGDEIEPRLPTGSHRLLFYELRASTNKRCLGVPGHCLLRQPFILGESRNLRFAVLIGAKLLGNTEAFSVATPDEHRSDGGRIYSHRLSLAGYFV
jgi:hypothetical protein